MSDLLTIKEAAELFGVHVDTLRRWEARGYFVPKYTPGGHRRYRLKEIEAFMEIQKNPIAYFVQYHDLASLPDRLTVHESVLIGETDLRKTNQLYNRTGLPYYQKFTERLPDRPQALEKRIFLFNKCENGLLPNLNFRGQYTIPIFCEDGGIIISMSRIWPEQEYCMSNRHNIAPDVIWGEEAVRLDNGDINVRTVCYKRVD